MQNVVLTVHLILAVLLTGVVLLQRSEGGGLGLGGGGGGGGGVMTGRQAANALTRLTWIFGIGIFITSVTLTVIAAQQATTGSVMDRFGGATTEAPASTMPGLPTYAPPPAAGQPVTPPAPDAPATTAPATTAPATEAPAAEAPATPAAPATEPVSPGPVTPPAPSN